MPPIIRRQPLSERIKALLNPYDFLLWLAEEMHESAIDEKLRDWTVPIGVATNFVYMIARANSANGSKGKMDDIFGDYNARSGSGWLTWFVSQISVHHQTCCYFQSLTYISRRRPLQPTPLQPSQLEMQSTSSLARENTAFSSQAWMSHPQHRRHAG